MKFVKCLLRTLPLPAGDGCTIGGSSMKGEVSNEWYVGYDNPAAGPHPSSIFSST